MAIKYFAWHDWPNFGDRLNSIILKHFLDQEVELVNPEDSQVVSIGSVLDVLPRNGYKGFVLGSGQLHETTFTDLSEAHVFGLRGFLTLERTLVSHDGPDLVIADPALLASDLVTPKKGRYPFGVVPHWTDEELWDREYDRSVKYDYAPPILIDPSGDPLDVLTKIGSCQKIVSSSLHGLIVADAFGIPRRAERFPAMITDSIHEGGDFKFEDYATSIGQPIEFGTLTLAPRVRIDQMQRDLFEMFRNAKKALHE